MTELTPKQKETWAGIRRPGTGTESNVVEARKKLEEELNYLAYRQDIWGSQEAESYSEHSTYLQDNAGFTQQEAESLNSKIESNLTDEDSSGGTWDEYVDWIEDQGQWDGWAELFGQSNGISSDARSEDGGAAAGVKVFETSGTTFEGVQAPAGAVEIYGQEIHFSQKSGSVEGSAGASSVSWSNLSVSELTPLYLETITVTADATNSGTADADIYPTLKVDGRVEKTGSQVTIASGNTETVSMQFRVKELSLFEIGIASLDPVTVSVQTQVLGP